MLTAGCSSAACRSSGTTFSRCRITGPASPPVSGEPEPSRSPAGTWDPRRPQPPRASARGPPSPAGPEAPGIPPNACGPRSAPGGCPPGACGRGGRAQLPPSGSWPGPCPGLRVPPVGPGACGRYMGSARGGTRAPVWQPIPAARRWLSVPARAPINWPAIDRAAVPARASVNCSPVPDRSAVDWPAVPDWPAVERARTGRAAIHGAAAGWRAVLRVAPGRGSRRREPSGLMPSGIARLTEPRPGRQIPWRPQQLAIVIVRCAVRPVRPARAGAVLGPVGAVVTGAPSSRQAEPIAAQAGVATFHQVTSWTPIVQPRCRTCAYLTSVGREKSPVGPRRLIVSNCP